MLRLFAFIAGFAAIAAGAQASPAVITHGPTVNLPIMPSGSTTHSGTDTGRYEIRPPFNTIGPAYDYGSGLTAKCEFCTGHDGGVGQLPR